MAFPGPTRQTRLSQSYFAPSNFVQCCLLFSGLRRDHPFHRRKIGDGAHPAGQPPAVRSPSPRLRAISTATARIRCIMPSCITGSVTRLECLLDDDKAREAGVRRAVCDTELHIHSFEDGADASVLCRLSPYVTAISACWQQAVCATPQTTERGGDFCIGSFVTGIAVPARPQLYGRWRRPATIALLFKSPGELIALLSELP